MAACWLSRRSQAVPSESCAHLCRPTRHKRPGPMAETTSPSTSTDALRTRCTTARMIPGFQCQPPRRSWSYVLPGDFASEDSKGVRRRVERKTLERKTSEGIALAQERASCAATRQRAKTHPGRGASWPQPRAGMTTWPRPNPEYIGA